MNIYKIKVDTNKFQWLMPQIDEEQLLEYLTFDCSTKVDKWRNINWYIFNPKNEAGNFYTLGTGGALIFDQAVYKSELYTLLEMAGEILAINVDGEQMYVLNVQECINALDETNSKREIYEDGSYGRILSFSFFEDRITESSIFKIPQTCKSEILTYTGVKDDSDEFKTLYNSHGFNGLLFERIF